MRDSITLLEDDTRAVASLLGFVLLFGIAVIGFSMYQAEVVPDQNAQTEFQHFEEAKDQMVAFRSAAIDTASVDVSRSVTFDLGTRFQQRYLAVNPPPPTGTLATSEQYNITINPGAANEEKISARFLEFDPNYREFHPGVLRYEHGIVYLDARETNGGVVVLAGESPESRLHLAPIQNEFSQTGQQRVSLEIFRPNNTEPLPTIDEVEIPTRLNESQWEDKIGIPVDNLRGNNPKYVTVDGSDISDVTPAGIQEQPERSNSTVESSNDRDGENGGNINNLGIFVEPDEEFKGGGRGGNDDLDALFNVDTNNGEYPISINASVAGNGQESVSVKIKDNQADFTDSAANDFTRDAREKNLLDEDNYDDPSSEFTNILEELRGDLSQESSINELTQDGGSRDLKRPEIR